MGAVAPPRERVLQRKRNRHRVRVQDDSTSGIHAAAATGATRIVEAGSLGISHLSMGTAGELLNGQYPIPWDLDPQWEIGYRIHYTVDVNSNPPIVEWILLAGTQLIDAAYVVPTGALDTVIGNHTYPSGTDLIFTRTNRGIDKKLGTINREQIEAGAKFTWSIEMQAITQTPTDVRFAWLEVDYVPMMTVGSGSHTDRPLASAPA